MKESESWTMGRGENREGGGKKVMSKKLRVI